jgi:hypothetical protein
MTSIIEFILAKLFIYLILGIITCSLVEMALIYRRTRSRILSEWLMRIFDCQVQLPDGRMISLGQAIMNHSLIIGLARYGSIPSYISAKNFTSALLEQITYDKNNPEKVDFDINELISALQKTNILSTELKRVFLRYAHGAKEGSSINYANNGNDIKNFSRELETWFNSSMDSLTETFKIKYARPLTFLMATLVVFALNVDSIAFVKLLYGNSNESKSIEQHMNNSTDSVLLKSINTLHPSSKNDSIILDSLRSLITTDIKEGVEQKVERQRLESESFSIGWNQGQLKENGNYSISKIIQKLLGLFATVLITILIAPIMFDLGNKISNSRGTGPKPASREVYEDD